MAGGLVEPLGGEIELTQVQRLEALADELAAQLVGGGCSRSCRNTVPRGNRAAGFANAGEPCAHLRVVAVALEVVLIQGLVTAFGTQPEQPLPPGLTGGRGDAGLLRSERSKLRHAIAASRFTVGQVLRQRELVDGLFGVGFG